MPEVRVCRLRDPSGFNGFCQEFDQVHAGLHLDHLHVDSKELSLRSDFGGMKLLWLYDGEGEVFLPKGYRTKEGDGHRLPSEYEPEPADPGLLATLDFLEQALPRVLPTAQPPIQSILSRRLDGSYVGDFAGDLWKLAHVPPPWSADSTVVGAIRKLQLTYRDAGYSIKNTESYERIMEGDQLAVAGNESLTVRGNFACLTLERIDRTVRHVSSAMRLRFLRDSSGGCNPDFDPFRRLPLTWHMNLPNESGDGVNFANSHVVNIPKETSPTHFHPREPVAGGAPQTEMYLVLDASAYGLHTFGRRSELLVYPELRDLSRCQAIVLEPGHFVYIPPGTGHRGLDVFVNVITVPGFKPHNEFYLDQEIKDAAANRSPYNGNLLGLKNYQSLADLI
ncbi:MAG: hypothetical protein HY706_02030 [Candidatus Hydrogenedentes bacterium]|nr:hypothetical protein [Candidatus Hydrogenedentota bacterium]